MKNPLKTYKRVMSGEEVDDMGKQPHIRNYEKKNTQALMRTKNQDEYDDWDLKKGVKLRTNLAYLKEIENLQKAEDKRLKYQTRTAQTPLAALGLGSVAYSLKKKKDIKPVLAMVGATGAAIGKMELDRLNRQFVDHANTKQRQEMDKQLAKKSFICDSENYMEKRANILSKKDAIKKSGKNKNMTLVTGFSGSGKTTLVDKIEKEHPQIVNVEIDGFQHGYDTSEDERVVSDFVDKYGPYNENANYGAEDIMNYLQDVARNNPEKHYVVNGVQFLPAPNKLFEDYPVVVKGTGLLKSSHRRLKRDKAFGNKGANDNILDAIKYNMKLNKDINRVRKIVKKNNMEKRAMSEKAKGNLVLGAVGLGGLGLVGSSIHDKRKEKVQAKINEKIKQKKIEQRNQALSNPQTKRDLDRFRKLESNRYGLSQKQWADWQGLESSLSNLGLITDTGETYSYHYDKLQKQASEYIEKQAMEKVAIAAWRKHIGKLSDKARKTLIDNGVLNYEKDIKGLRRGNANLAKKYDIKILRKPEQAGRYTKELVKEDAKKQGIKVGKSEIESFVEDAKTSGPHSQVNPHMEPVKSLKGKKGYSYIPKNQRKQFEKDTGIKPLQGKLNKRYEQALTERHEIDEARYQSQALSNKKKRLKDKDGGVAAMTDFRGHNSPKVLARESANVASAPKEVRRYMETARGGVGEMADLRKNGIVYGQSGQYQRNAANKMEKAQIPKNQRKFYRQNGMEIPKHLQLKPPVKPQPQFQTKPAIIKPSTTNSSVSNLHNSNGTINLSRNKNIINNPLNLKKNSNMIGSNLHNSNGTINLKRKENAV